VKDDKLIGYYGGANCPTNEMKKKKYTLMEVLDRLMLTDEEVLLCKQHREYADKLDEMLPEFDDERMDVIGQNGNDGTHYATIDSEGNLTSWAERLGQPPE
jgi:hypothetical protein